MYGYLDVRWTACEHWDTQPLVGLAGVCQHVQICSQGETLVWLEYVSIFRYTLKMRHLFGWNMSACSDIRSRLDSYLHEESQHVQIYTRGETLVWLECVFQF